MTKTKTKICTKCKQEKSLSEFYKHKRYKDGHCHTCKSCAYKQQKEYRQQPKIAENRKQYYKEYIKTHKEQYKKTQRKSHLGRTFGITPEDYDQMVKDQNNLCAVCGKPETMMRNGKPIALSVDHNHETGEIRGLLCFLCNSRLAYLEDMDFVLKARLYLARHNSMLNI